jgi:hypothetical protein
VFSLLHFIDRSEAEKHVLNPGDVMLRFSMQTGSLAYAFKSADRPCIQTIISKASSAEILAKVFQQSKNVKRLVVKNESYCLIPKGQCLKNFAKSCGSTSVKVPEDYDDFESLGSL